MFDNSIDAATKYGLVGVQAIFMRPTFEKTPEKYRLLSGNNQLY